MDEVNIDDRWPFRPQILEKVSKDVTLHPKEKRISFNPSSSESFPPPQDLGGDEPHEGVNRILANVWGEGNKNQDRFEVYRRGLGGNPY